MTDVPLPLPDEFPWGYLTGRVIRVLPMDTIDDEDRIPEARGASGQITLTPKNRAATAGTNLVVHEGATLDIDNQGYLVNAHGEREPIAVVVGRYAVSFKLNSGQIQGYDIEITTNHTQEAPLQLASAAPPPIPTTGVTTMVVPTGAFEGGYLGYLDGSLAWITGGGSGGSHTHPISEVVDLQATLNSMSSEIGTAADAASANTSDIIDLTTRVDSLEDRPTYITLTQAEYDALDPVDPDQLYVVTG